MTKKNKPQKTGYKGNGRNKDLKWWKITKLLGRLFSGKS